MKSIQSARSAAACIETLSDLYGEHVTEFDVFERLFAGHLEVLSREWLNLKHGMSRMPTCPFCFSSHMRQHEPDCPWLISARACGVA